MSSARVHPNVLSIKWCEAIGKYRHGPDTTTCDSKLTAIRKTVTDVDPNTLLVRNISFHYRRVDWLVNKQQAPIGLRGDVKTWSLLCIIPATRSTEELLLYLQGV